MCVGDGRALTDFLLTGDAWLYGIRFIQGQLQWVQAGDLGAQDSGQGSDRGGHLEMTREAARLELYREQIVNVCQGLVGSDLLEKSTPQIYIIEACHRDGMINQPLQLCGRLPVSCNGTRQGRTKRVSEADSQRFFDRNHGQRSG